MKSHVTECYRNLWNYVNRKFEKGCLMLGKRWNKRGRERKEAKWKKIYGIMWLERKSCKENSQRGQGIVEIKRGRQKCKMILMKIKTCLGNRCSRLNDKPPIDLMELNIKIVTWFELKWWNSGRRSLKTCMEMLMVCQGMEMKWVALLISQNRLMMWNALGMLNNSKAAGVDSITRQY